MAESAGYVVVCGVDELVRHEFGLGGARKKYLVYFFIYPLTR